MKLFQAQPEVNQSHIWISASESPVPFQFLNTMLFRIIKKTMRSISQGMDIMILTAKTSPKTNFQALYNEWWFWLYRYIDKREQQIDESACLELYYSCKKILSMMW